MINFFTYCVNFEIEELEYVEGAKGNLWYTAFWLDDDTCFVPDLKEGSNKLCDELFVIDDIEALRKKYNIVKSGNHDEFFFNSEKEAQFFIDDYLRNQLMMFKMENLQTA